MARHSDFVPDILVIHRQNHVDWGWSDSEKRDSFPLTAGVDGGGQSPQEAPDAKAGNGRGAEAQVKAKRSDRYLGLTKGARRSGMMAKAIVTQPFESRDNRAMPLS